MNCVLLNKCFILLFPTLQKKDYNVFGTPGQDWRTGLSPLSDDAARLRMDNNQLRLQVKQLQLDLQSEQGMVHVHTYMIQTIVGDSTYMKQTIVGDSAYIIMKYRIY
jgi:hypothetical protein